MSGFQFSRLATPGVVVLISFLSYSSQVLFRHLDPRPLNGAEFIQFNLLVACIWICYARTCLIDPGHVPANWAPKPVGNDMAIPESKSLSRQRWCRKCENFKPPRSHHCKVCKRCIPKMDHHCPWTNNCVSHFTFPHFVRFLSYAVASMVYLEYFLFVRGADLWDKRKLPSYLGPSRSQLVHFFMLLFVNSLTLFLVSITFFRAIWALGGNTTTIEDWEIERHHQLVRRARVLGGYLDGPDGKKIAIRRQEFPYDIGIWQNFKQGMGTGNILFWLWPFAWTPRTPGLQFEVNGFEESNTTWPPPDPDRMPRLQRRAEPTAAFTYQDSHLTEYDEVQAFKARQEADFRRRQEQNEIIRRKPFHSRFGPDSATGPQRENAGNVDLQGSDSGEEGWQDSGGNRLKDYGVDEDLEFYDEDDIPLSELMRRREERKRAREEAAPRTPTMTSHAHVRGDQIRNG